MTDPTTLNLSLRDLDLILPELTEDERTQLINELWMALQKILGPRGFAVYLAPIARDPLDPNRRAKVELGLDSKPEI